MMLPYQKGKLVTCGLDDGEVDLLENLLQAFRLKTKVLERIEPPEGYNTPIISIEVEGSDARNRTKIPFDRLSDNFDVMDFSNLRRDDDWSLVVIKRNI